MYRKMKIDIYLDSGGDSTSEKAGDAAGSEDEYYIHTKYIYIHLFTYYIYMYRKMKIDIYLDSGGDSSREEAGDAAGSIDQYDICNRYLYIPIHIYIYI